jgi:hypothetical protein
LQIGKNLVYVKNNIFYTLKGDFQKDIPNFSDPDIQIIDAKYIDERLYVLSSQGLSIDDQLVYALQAVHDVKVGKKYIYIATDIGVYKAFKEISDSYKWQKVSSSPNLARKIVLNRTKTNIKYIAGLQSVHKYDGRKKSFINISQGLRFKDFNPSEYNLNFIGFVSADNHLLYANEFGLFKFNGRSWQALRLDLQPSSTDDQLYKIYKIVKFKNLVALATNNGLYYSVDDQLSKFKALKLTSFAKNQDYQVGVRSLFVNKNKLYFGTEFSELGILELSRLADDVHIKATKDLTLPINKVAGVSAIAIDEGNPSSAAVENFLSNSSPDTKYQLISRDKSENYILTQDANPKLAKESISNPQNKLTLLELAKEKELKKSQALIRNIKKVFELEPSIKMVHRQAMLFAEIPSGKRFRAYKNQARMRNLLPEVDTYLTLDQNDFHSLEDSIQDDFDSDNNAINLNSSLDDIYRNSNGYEAGFRMSWNLGNSIYDPELVDITNAARSLTNIRENLLSEITQIYYSRKQFLIGLLKQDSPPELDELIKLESFNAELDAKTGGWYSSKLLKNHELITLLNKKGIYYEI